MATARHLPPTCKIPSPAELGLPPKFDSWRHNQEAAVELIITSDKRVTTICAPTGFGKSAVAVAASILSNVPTCIVTSTCGLQSQYEDDFEGVGMVDLRGRANYKCDMCPEDPDYTCDEGYASRCPYKGTIACPCSQAEMRASASSLVVTNYDKWTSARKFGQGLAHIQQVIFDEAHDAPRALARAMQVLLHHREVEEGLKVDFPDAPMDFANWKIWAKSAREVAQAAMIAAQARITGLANPKPAWVKHFTHMRNLLRRLGILSTAGVLDWVVEEIDNGYQFDPIKPARYAESALLLKVPRIICISATVRPKTMNMIGMYQFDFKEFDSDFDPKRCPIYYIPTMRVDKWATDLTMLWVLHDQIAARRRDIKSIVQTISYARQKDIIGTSRFAASMIINEKGEPPTETIELFRKSAPGTILVSPSIGTGYDFADDDSRSNFVCKVPFEPPSKIVKARESNDPEYRSYQAMQCLTQMFGRDVRSKTDWSEGWIGDQHCDWFIPRYGHLAPSSFHARLKRVSIVPPPLRLGM